MLHSFRSFMLCCMVTASIAGAEAVAQVTTIPSAPILRAKAYALIDYDSGYTLAATEENTVLEPASLTKMMTVYVIDKALQQGSLQLTDPVMVSENAWHAGGSRMFLPLGKTATVSELLHGVIIQSGNDASIALAEHVAGSETAFAELMNQEAQRLGMQHTHFANASGLPHPDHRTTAKDMAILARAIIHDFPESYALYAEKWFAFNGIKQPNRNRLLWQDSTVDGIKTGHTEQAGYCLVASAKRSDMRLIAVVMGTPHEKARAEETKKLLNYGFQFFRSKRIYAQDVPLLEYPTWYGQRSKTPVGLERDFYAALPVQAFAQLQAEYRPIAPQLLAPVRKGQNIGHLCIYRKTSQGKQLVEQLPVLALADNPAGSLWRYVMDYIHWSWQLARSAPDDTLHYAQSIPVSDAIGLR